MKYKIYLLTLLMSGILLLSCQKDENTPIREKKSSSTNATFLSFKDRNAFETAIKSKDSKGLRTANFKSLKESSNDLGIDSEFLLSILSTEGEIQIGQWLFKLNGKDKTVKVLDPTTKASIGNFTFDDDVLDYLENGITSTPTANQRVNLFCGEGGVSVSSPDPSWSGSFTYKDYKTKGGCKVRYIKGGIYFELKLFYGIDAPLFGVEPPYIKEREYWIEPKCKGVSHNYVTGAGRYNNDGDAGIEPFWGDDEKIYASTTALHRLKVVHTYTWSDDNGNYLGVASETVSRGF